MKPVLVLAMGMGLVAACSAPTVESGRGCGSTVTAAVAPFGITPAEVADATVSVQTESGEEHRVVGYTYWISPKVCSAGRVIVDITDFCHVSQVYTTGGCQISGVRHY